MGWRERERTPGKSRGSVSFGTRAESCAVPEAEQLVIRGPEVITGRDIETPLWDISTGGLCPMMRFLPLSGPWFPRTQNRGQLPQPAFVDRYC